jgi:hypothetical protein
VLKAASINNKGHPKQVAFVISGSKERLTAIDMRIAGAGYRAWDLGKLMKINTLKHRARKMKKAVTNKE